MKKLISIIIVLLLLGCSIQAQETSSGPMTSTDVSYDLLIQYDEVSIQSDSPANDPTPSVCSDIDIRETSTPKADIMEAGNADNIETNITSPKVEQPVLQQITIREFDREKAKAGESFTTEIYNETIDFREFSYTVQSVQIDDSGTTIIVSVLLPNGWSELQRKSFIHTMSFRIYLDDKLVDFYMEENTAVMNDDNTCTGHQAYTMIYRNRSLCKDQVLQKQTIRIVPYYYYWIQIGGQSANGHPGGNIYLDKGERCIFDGTERFYGGKPAMCELDMFSTSFDVHGTAEYHFRRNADPKIMQVTIRKKDWEKNTALGFYEEGVDNIPFEYGTFQNVDVDFSNISMSLEKAYYSEYGLYLLLHIMFPEEWDQQTCFNFKHDMIVNLLFDGETIQKNYHIPKTTFVYNDNWGYRNTKCREYEETYEPRDIYVYIEAKQFYEETPFPAKEITIQLLYRNYTAIVMENKTYDLTQGQIVETNAYYDQQYTKVLITDITIPTSIFYKEK